MFNVNEEYEEYEREDDVDNTERNTYMANVYAQYAQCRSACVASFIDPNLD